VRGIALQQPLVSRPAYGEGRSTVAESGLPGGGPSNKGLPLDSGIPGSATFNKPSGEEARDFDKGKDKPIDRVDNADDLLSDRDRVDTREDNAKKENGVSYMPTSEWDSSTKTKYPYRDGIPNTHSASAEFVAALWEAEHAPTLRIAGETRIKTALRLEAIVDGLNPEFKQRAGLCSVATKRVSTKNLRWILSVDCGNGAKVVKVKGFRNKTITKLSKMDLDLSCSCPAWRWLGPEFHSKTEDYLDGKPRGTASVPVIRDPTGVNRVCKHVAAVLAHIKKWDVAKAKKK